uniref:RAB43, member RAS oncogene family n=1 Tax=Zonotrichia albicollis TaxID=44394 RepID=A0A8D2MZT5_ZONAL
LKTIHMGAIKDLQIWDTAGQERFRTITQSYYRSANGAILAYDISKRGSFLSIPRWIEDVRKYAGSNIVQLLIGELGTPLLVQCGVCNNPTENFTKGAGSLEQRSFALLDFFESFASHLMENWDQLILKLEQEANEHKSCFQCSQ